MTIKIIQQAAISLLLATASVGAYAAGCATPQNAFDQVYCAGNLYAQVDHDLNVAYGNLKKHLTAAQSNSLKTGQLAWIKQRDANCSESKADGFYVNLQCAVDTTQARLAFLKERDRECTSTGCVSSKIGE
jgi:uncharacterized protein YecT (DUF1311 family)